MALLHNSILRGYNSIYHQAPIVAGSDKADFVGYCLTWYKFVKSHHDDEEQTLFTKIEELLDDKTIFEETHKEHGKNSGTQTGKHLLTLRCRLFPRRPRGI